MIFITGDTHSHIDINRLKPGGWPIGQRLTRDDYLVILGDFGLDINTDWPTGPDWFYWLKKQPWTTLFVDGNHDNIPFLDTLPREEWNDGKIGMAADNIYHLRRGEVYQIGWNSIFTMGGAYSIDKAWREPYISWWPQEIPSYQEWEYALSNLEKVNYTVDKVFAHTMPTRYAKAFLAQGHGSFGKALNEKKSILEADFDKVIENGQLRFTDWYCGHWHPNNKWRKGNIHCYYYGMDSFSVDENDVGRVI